MPLQGVSTRIGVLPFPAMREGRFCTFWVYIMASRTGTLDAERLITAEGGCATRVFWGGAKALREVCMVSESGFVKMY